MSLGRGAGILLLMGLLPGCGLFGGWKAESQALRSTVESLSTWKKSQTRRLQDMSDQIDRLEERLRAQERAFLRQKETLDGLSSWTMENLLALQTEFMKLNQGGVRRSIESVLQERLRETEARIREQAFLSYATPFLESVELDDERREQVLEVLSRHGDRLRRLYASAADDGSGNLDVSIRREMQVTEDRLAALLSSRQLEAYRSFRKKRGLWPPLPSAEATAPTTR